MALFFGLRPCKGKVNFDDIHITTASEKPVKTPFAWYTQVVILTTNCIYRCPSAVRLPNHRSCYVDSR